MSAKTKAKVQKESPKLQKLVVIVGYTLFLATVVAVTFGTVIPFVELFLSPYVLKGNVALFLVTLTAGAILPTSIAYLVGDRATRGKNRLLHHYNGVLFGVAAYWISTLLSMFMVETINWSRDTFPMVAAEIINMWPIVLTSIILVFVAILYAGSQKGDKSVLENRAYQTVLAVSIIGFFVYAAFHQSVDDASFLIRTIASFAVPLILTIVGYALFKKAIPSKRTRFTAALVAMSLGGIALSITTQLAYQITGVDNIVANIAPYIVAVLVWVLYVVQVRKT